MKWLKTWESVGGSGSYQKVDQETFYRKKRSNLDLLTEREVGEIESLMPPDWRKYAFSIPPAGINFKPRSLDGKIIRRFSGIYIYKLSDEWFVVECYRVQGISSFSEFYICDEYDGLKLFLQDFKSDELIDFKQVK